MLLQEVYAGFEEASRRDKVMLSDGCHLRRISVTTLISMISCTKCGDGLFAGDAYVSLTFPALVEPGK